MSHKKNVYVCNLPLTTCGESDALNIVLCDQQTQSISTLCDADTHTFLRLYTTVNGAVVGFVDRELDGVTPFVPTLPVGVCSTGGGGGGALTWEVVTTGTQAMQPDHGYIVDNVSLGTFLTLPAVAPVGSIIRVVANDIHGWQIFQNAGQSIYLLDGITTVGTGGYVASLYPYASVEMVCVEANVKFAIISSVGDFELG